MPHSLLLSNIKLPCMLYLLILFLVTFCLYIPFLFFYQSEEKDPTEIDSPHENVIEGQVYINISPPMTACNSVGASGSGRPRSRSYDRNLDKSPSPRLGSLERMLSCPVRLSESAAPSPPPPPRVTSFAEIARNKRRTGGSPSQRGGIEATSTHSYSSGEFSPILEGLPQGQSHSLPPLTRCHSQGSCEQTRTKAEGKRKFSTISSKKEDS